MQADRQSAVIVGGQRSGTALMSALGHKRTFAVHQRMSALCQKQTRHSACGKLRRSFCGSLGVNYGIERYFVPEGEGRAIEQARNRSNVTVVAAVARDSRATIKRLLMDGKPIYDEPLF
ncbi:MAG: GDYXXLXY domain-containing protein [Pseudolabrys sp.]